MRDFAPPMRSRGTSLTELPAVLGAASFGRARLAKQAAVVPTVAAATCCGLKRGVWDPARRPAREQLQVGDISQAQTLRLIDSACRL